jgi:hypothetical protein
LLNGKEQHVESVVGASTRAKFLTFVGALVALGVHNAWWWMPLQIQSSAIRLEFVDAGDLTHLFGEIPGPPDTPFAGEFSFGREEHNPKRPLFCAVGCPHSCFFALRLSRGACHALDQDRQSTVPSRPMSGAVGADRQRSIERKELCTCFCSLSVHTIQFTLRHTKFTVVCRCDEPLWAAVALFAAVRAQTCIHIQR